MTTTEEVLISAADGHVVPGTLVTPPNSRGLAVLVHGITADRHEWGFFDFLAEALSRRGIISLAIDYRGHGKSALPIEQLSLSGVFLDIQAAWRLGTSLFRDGHQARFIVGNSFGGGLSYLFGQLTASVDQIIMTCPVTSYVADLARVTTDWAKLAHSGFIPYASKRLGTHIIPEMFAYDTLIELSPTTTPFSVVHGTADSDVPFVESSAFVRARRGAGSLHPLEDMDHSFSAPEGLPNRDATSRQYRQRAAEYVATLIEESLSC